MSLERYLDDCRDLLRDWGNLFVPQRTMVRAVNLARDELSYQTGCIRRLIAGQAPFGTGAQPGNAIPGAVVPGMLPGSQGNNLGPGPSTPINSFNAIPNVEMYSYDFGNQYLRQQYSGLDGITDVIAVAVSWGSERPAMEWMPWEDLQALARAYNTGVTSYPFKWSVYNDGALGQVWLFPVPSFACEMEWDVTCKPKPIYSNDDFDAIPEPFRSAVKFYAVGYLYLTSQRAGLANTLFQMFDDAILTRRVSSDRGKIASMYETWP